MIRTALFLPTLALVLSACAPDVSEGRVTATVSEPAPSTEAVVTTGALVGIDVAASTVKALGAKITATHPIEFDEWDGQLRMDGDQLTGVEVIIQMNSLRADVEDLTHHLKNEDFFDVTAFPTARFVSSSVTAKSGADGATHEVTGDLTMHGQTQRITFPATVRSEGGAVRATSEFVVDRQDFGIAYPGMPDDLIQDNVVLTIDLVSKAS